MGLSQSTLAKAAGTSQQQIQRIEANAQSIKLDLAVRIAGALKTDLSHVFPDTKPLLRQLGQEPPNELRDLINDDETVEGFDNAGIDLRPETWLLKLRLRGARELTFPLSTADRHRFWRCITGGRDDSTPFFVFTSRSVVVALNFDHLLHCHDLFEATDAMDSWEDPSVQQEKVAVYMSEQGDPLCFDVEPDEITDESGDEIGQLAHVRYMLETLVEPGDFFHFNDVDGEEAFFRTSEVALMTIPIGLFWPEEAEEEPGHGEDNHEETEVNPPGDTPP